MKNRRVLIAVVIVLVAVIVAFAKLPGLRTSLPGSVIRFCLGEPGATQWVNNTADKIIDSGWTKELEVLADQLSKDPQVSVKSLRSNGYAGLPTLSSNKLPVKFRKLADWPYNDEEATLLKRSEENGSETIIVSWGHGRERILIFGIPPAIPPKGFFVRQVNSRIYVVANES